MTRSNTKLLNQAQRLARDLRKEGRRTDAQTVDALLQAVTNSRVEDAEETAPYLTTGEVAQRVGVSRQTVVNWVKKGLLPGVRLGGRTLVTPVALQRFTQIEGIMNELDVERQPATSTEAAEAVRQTRKGWMWHQQNKQK